MESSRGGRRADDRAALLRRIGWERTGFRVLRLAFAMVFVVGGVVLLAGAGGSRVDGLVPLGLGLVLLWELRRGDSTEAASRPLTSEQTQVLEATLQREGRLAAVKQLRGWTGASYGDAARDIDAAFPETTTDATRLVNAEAYQRPLA